MFKIDLAMQYIKLKEDVVSSILFAFRDARVEKGEYKLLFVGFGTITTHEGEVALKKIIYNGDNDLILVTVDSHYISINDLNFEDLLYFYELIEGGDIDLPSDLIISI